VPKANFRNDSEKRFPVLRFTKMAATGNDFILIDNRNGRFTGRERKLFAALCRRRFSVGADGLVLVEKGRNAPVRMRYYNRDGGEAAMCGNAARCTALFSFRKGFVKRPAFDLEALDGLHSVRVRGRTVTVRMRPAFGYRTGFGIVREGEGREGGFVDTGVPHYVLFVEDLKRVDVEGIAPYYRSHPVFPGGVNVNFVKAGGPGRIAVRTFERGVEGETLSCGTGCVASALIASRAFGGQSRIGVDTRGGKVTVSFDAAWQRVDLTGPADFVFEGMMSPRAVSG